MHCKKGIPWSTLHYGVLVLLSTIVGLTNYVGFTNAEMFREMMEQRYNNVRSFSSGTCMLLGLRTGQIFPQAQQLYQKVPLCNQLRCRLDQLVVSHMAGVLYSLCKVEANVHFACKWTTQFCWAVCLSTEKIQWWWYNAGALSAREQNDSDSSWWVKVSCPLQDYAFLQRSFGSDVIAHNDQIMVVEWQHSGKNLPTLGTFWSYFWWVTSD